jgi:HEAT repeat protein
MDRHFGSNLIVETNGRESMDSIMDVSQLIADVKSSDVAKRVAAAEQLSHLESEAQGAAIALVQATVDADESVRQWATSALESIGPPAADDAGEMAKLLSDSRLDVAYWSATLLGRLRTDAAPTVPQLIVALKSHAEIAVRQRAAWALGEIGKYAAPALDALNDAAKSSDPRLARLAQQAIANIK